MLKEFQRKVYLAVGRTGLRREMDGLAAIVQQQFELDPFTETLFPFCGRYKNRIKRLLWEGSGFPLLYKRLKSSTFQWLETGEEALRITPQQYRWLMEGLNIEQPRAHRLVDGISCT